MTLDPSQAARAAIDAGAAHYAAGRLAQAEAAMRDALTHRPGDLDAMANLGAILRSQGRAAEALDVYRQILAQAPGHAAARLNRANLLNDLKRWPEALEDADQALRAAPENPGAHNARGNALLELGRRPEAAASYREAVRIAPSYAPAWFNLGKALLEQGEAGDALDAYAAAARFAPGLAAVQAGQGHALSQLKRLREASAAYDRAWDLDPNLPYLAGHRLHARMKLCDWRDYDRLTDDLAHRIDAGAPAASPFAVGAAPLSPAQQRRCAEVYAADTFRAAPRPKGAPAEPRLRLGYFSADFHEHATAHLIAEMLELHDREAFEVTCFSYGPSTPSPMRGRLQAATERFYDVRTLGTGTVCDLARGLGLDIAVDLKGYTAQARPEIFAAGVAPIQVSFLGLPMTMGAAFMDYIIADRVLIALEDVAFYSEKIAWAAGSYQPNDRQRAISPVATTRQDHGLPPDAFVFASFNAAYKITPAVFGVWMEILRSVPGSVLWLMRDDDAPASLIAEARARGIDPSRLIFAPFRPAPEHLERAHHADLFLDTFPYTAHTTGSDALWAGLPLITRRGDTFASRVAASLLTAAGLSELAVESEADYLAMALALARDPARLRGCRERVARARTASALFDTPAYVRDLESLYRRMQTRRLEGLGPDHLR